jgi:3'-5' exoribonuclease
MLYIKDIKEHEQVKSTYFCKSKHSLRSKTGGTYLSLILQDKTGTIDAKIWKLTNDISYFEENNFITIDAIAIFYKNSLQLKISKVRKSLESEYDKLDYLDNNNKIAQEAYEIIMNFIKSINNINLKSLLTAIFIEDKKIIELFKSHSAGKSIHHCYPGGLIEHSVSMLKLCETVSKLYDKVDKELLMSSALLHDIGKIFELSSFPNNEYTDDGKLLGHIIIGIDIINKKIEAIPGFPQKLKSLLIHNIVSHHGSLEYGSPKLPVTLEAFILSHIDTLDSQVNMFLSKIDYNSSSSPNDKSCWIGYQKYLGRDIRITKY